MRSVICTRCSKSDLAALLGVSPLRIERWTRQGLPVNVDGSFTLSAVCRWREERHRSELAGKLTASLLSQKQLGGLFGVFRQAVTNWTRNGMPRNRGMYDLPDVLRWLRKNYRASARKEYQARLETIRTKIHRNIAQCERFLSGGKVK